MQTYFQINGFFYSMFSAMLSREADICTPFFI